MYGTLTTGDGLELRVTDLGYETLWTENGTMWESVPGRDGEWTNPDTGDVGLTDDRTVEPR